MPADDSRVTIGRSRTRSDPAGNWGTSENTTMRRIETALVTEDPATVVTVTNVEGNAYRRPGAKMLVDGKGLTGSVTAGCIQNEIQDIATVVGRSGTPRLQRFDLTDDDQWGIGLGCDGVIDLLFEPLDERFAQVVDSYRSDVDGLSLTVIDGAGRTAVVRDRLYVPDGDLSSSEYDFEWLCGKTADQIGELYHAGRAATLSVPDRSGVRVFADPIHAPPELYIFGSGSDVHPVIEFARRAGFRVTVVPFRGGKASASEFPHADRVVSAVAPRLTESLSFSETSYAVVMSHNLIDDQLALESLLDTPVSYIGLMGPPERFEKIRDGLAIDGRYLSQSERDRIYAPVGLNLGGGAPDQIAMGIVSELLVVHNELEPQHLRRRQSPIHDRHEHE